MFKSARRQARYNRLINAGFQPFEARALSGIPPKSAPYLKAMVIPVRRQLIRKAEKEYNSLTTGKYIKDTKANRRQHILNTIKGTYQANNWTILPTARTRLKTIGNADVWQMLRFYRDRWLDKYPSDYIPPLRKRRKRYDEHDRRIDKGQVTAQKARWRERQRRRRQQL